MTREDARASYWKERFLYGLPRALIEKVQESLRERFQGTIHYDDLTYGDLISEVKKEGLKLCTQLKLQYKVKKDLKASRKDLGSFCSKYGIDQVPLPLRIQRKPDIIIQNIKPKITQKGKKKNINAIKTKIIFS